MCRTASNSCVKPLSSICISLEQCDGELLHSCHATFFQAFLSWKVVVHFARFWVLLLHLKLCGVFAANTYFRHLRQNFRCEENEAVAKRESVVVSQKT